MKPPPKPTLRALHSDIDERITTQNAGFGRGVIERKIDSHVQSRCIPLGKNLHKKKDELFYHVKA